MRRIRTKLSLLLPLLLLLQGTLFAQNLTATIQREDNTYYLSLQHPPQKTKQIIESLKEGYNAEIQFHIRLYRSPEGLLRLFGDRLENEYHPGYRAQWDPFYERFIVTDWKENEYTYQRQENFLDRFFSLPRYPIDYPLDKTASYYILTSVKLTAMTLVPPLTLLKPLLSLGNNPSSWKRIDLPRAGGKRP